MFFEITGGITDVRVIARGKEFRSLPKLRKKYGAGRWRKLKGRTQVRLGNGSERIAEVRWYEAHGIGKKDFKIKRFLD
ncbi:MAG TPA: hypothetical protein VHY91_21940 [Pirellulales bacterium]|jgi:hypothetical protein|nr:hypothetical protein [Pirellulales bacterium]